MDRRHGGITTVLNTIGIVLCVLLLPILAVNVTLIVKSFISSGHVPDFFGYKPLIVLSGSMEPTISEGDLIVTRAVEPSSLKEGDVVSYRFGENAVVTHRIVSLDVASGQGLLVTKGDANNVVDRDPVHPDKVEGRYLFRVPGLGRFAMFLQTPMGLLLVVGGPVLLYILADYLIRRRKAGKAGDAEALRRELDALKEQLRREEGEKPSATV